MSNRLVKNRSPVRRGRAESYLLTSLIAFAVTVIATRTFLELTGYPQIGNSVLHIAHALWGGLLLFAAAILPLALANRWALWSSALLGGVGIGLFIDEVGKFITQSNDYFFPPSLSIVYGFFLLTVLVYLYFRRPQPPDPRQALYHSPEGLRDALDGDLNTEEAAQIEEELAIAKNSDRQEVAALAEAISRYLRVERRHLPEVEYGYWKWATTWVDGLGTRLGRARHRTVISLLLILWVVFPVGYVAVLIQGRATLDSQVVQWRGLLIAVQALVGVLMVVAVVVWLAGKEALGLKLSISGFLLSLVALQTLYFYLSQFSAIVATLLQIALLQILLVYRRRYLISHAVAT